MLPTALTTVPPLDIALPPPEPDAASPDAVRARTADRASAAARVSAARAGGDPLSLEGLGDCIEEARQAALAPVKPPRDPVEFEAMRTRLEKACEKLPATYRREVGKPLLATLDMLGAQGFEEILAADPGRTGPASLLLDLCGAVLQRAEGYEPKATAAFQEVVSDLYDGFLSAEARRGVKPPDHGAVAPLVRWGEDPGPATWAATATEVLGAGAGVVVLPAGNADAGLLAWPALAHETAGHDIVEADAGLCDELERGVRAKLVEERMSPALADYWADRVGETSADVLGVLNMGPAAAAGLVGYLRGMNGAHLGAAKLRNVGPKSDPHPADIARGYVVAETVRLLSFEGAGAWADRLVAEVDRDVAKIKLGDAGVTPAVAKASAAVVARTIVRTRLATLEGRSLGEIQNWSDRDEAIVAELRGALRDPRGAAAASAARAEGAYAAHAVAAGVYEALGGGEAPRVVMGRMISVLDAMHARNPQWAGAGPGERGAGAPQVKTGARPSPTSGS